MNGLYGFEESLNSRLKKSGFPNWTLIEAVKSSSSSIERSDFIAESGKEIMDFLLTTHAGETNYTNGRVSKRLLR